MIQISTYFISVILSGAVDAIDPPAPNVFNCIAYVCPCLSYKEPLAFLRFIAHHLE